jgi:hypothetical protein
VQLLDRRQQRLELVLLSLDNFVEPPPNVYHSENHLSASCAPAQVISVQTSDIWINVCTPHLEHFLCASSFHLTHWGSNRLTACWTFNHQLIFVNLQ